MLNKGYEEEQNAIYKVMCVTVTPHERFHPHPLAARRRIVTNASHIKRQIFKAGTFTSILQQEEEFPVGVDVASTDLKVDYIRRRYDDVSLAPVSAANWKTPSCCRRSDKPRALVDRGVLEARTAQRAAAVEKHRSTGR